MSDVILNMMCFLCVDQSVFSDAGYS